MTWASAPRPCPLLSAPEQASTEMIGVVVTPLPETNAELLNGKPFKEIVFDRKRPESGGPSVPFNAIQMSYQGEAKDGRPVAVFVWAEPDDPAKGDKAVIRTRIGLKRDDAWGETFLAKVAARLDAPQVKPPATVELPPSR